MSMKKFLLSIFALFAVTSLLLAQENTTTTTTKKVVVIQKITNDDGSVTVKKKSFDKGENVETYVEALEPNAGETDHELTIIVNGQEENPDAEKETVMFFRQGGKHKDKDFHHEAWGKKLERFHVTMPKDYDNTLIFMEDNKAFMGVESESSDEGLILTGIVPGSGAEAAKLMAGDVVTSVEGENIRTSTELRNVLAKHEPGDEVTVNFLRNGNAQTATVKLTERKERRNFNYNYNYNYSNERNPCEVFIGVYLGGYGEGLEGVGVSGIVPNTPAEKAGMLSGDRIISIDGVSVTNYSEVLRERNKHKAGDFFTIGYLRNGEPNEVEAQFKECPTEKKEEIVEEVKPQTPVTPLPVAPSALELDELNAYPNPTYGDLNVQFKGEAVPTHVQITDIQGKVVYTENLPDFDGVYSKKINVGNATPGTLTLTVRQGDKLQSKAVVLLNRA